MLITVIVGVLIALVLFNVLSYLGCLFLVWLDDHWRTLLEVIAWIFGFMVVCIIFCFALAGALSA